MGFRRFAAVAPIVIAVLVAGSAVAPLAAQGSAAGSAWHTVTFSGVRLQVPSSWPVVNLARQPFACPRLDVHAVYLGTAGPDSSCPAGLRGKTEAVQLEPANPQSPDVREATRPVTIDGRPARTNLDSAITHTIIDVLPAAGVEVSVSYGSNEALATAISATIRIGAGARAVPLMQARSLPLGSPQGYFHGQGFDTCAAPSAAAMNSWLASRYRAVGIYIGGINRACAQANLTAGWISAIQARGWHYFPFYVGLQATCMLNKNGNAAIKPRKAAAQGAAAAADAATQARNLGIPPGTPLIYDMEAYAGCGKQVTGFLGAWDSQLRAEGYRAGIYESFSNIGDLVSAAGTMTEPAVMDYADWDGRATASSSYLPAGLWAGHQRIHQYQGGHNETWGRVRMNIDNDQLDVSLSAAAAAAAAAAPGLAGVRMAVSCGPVTPAAHRLLPPAGSGTCR
jgi:hypothetical protein